MRPGTNRFLTYAVALNVMLVLAALYWPPVAALLGTQPLGANDLAVTAAVSLAAPLAVEVEKAMLRRRADPRPEVG